MEQVEIARLAAEQLGVGEPGAIVARGEARDRQRLAHRIGNGARRKIGGAGVPFLLADVDRDAEPLVAVVLDGLDFALAHGHGLPVAVGDLRLAAVGPPVARVPQHVGGDFLQGLVAQRKACLGHRWIGAPGERGRTGKSGYHISTPATHSPRMIDQERPSKTQRQEADARAAGARRAPGHAQRRAARRNRAARATCAKRCVDAQRIPGRESRRRQMQYIGRLMREVDPEPIREKIAAWDGAVARARREAPRHRALARAAARRRSGLDEFLRERPGADSQRLRSLIRNARAEREAARPPKSYRELFRLLRDILRAP